MHIARDTLRAIQSVCGALAPVPEPLSTPLEPASAHDWHLNVVVHNGSVHRTINRREPVEEVQIGEVRYARKAKAQQRILSRDGPQNSWSVSIQAY